MVRVAYNQTNFTAGEISPKMLGRGDIDRYPNAVKYMANAYPLIYGGAKRHFGSHFEAEVKNSSDKVRLIPFIFSRDQAYILEVGPGYIRFYTPEGRLENAGVPVEVASPYISSDLFELEYTQGADSMFLVTEDVTPQRLLRLSANSFQMGNIPFDVMPFSEWGQRLQADLTIIGGGTTLSASAGVFLPSDVGRTVTAGSGVTLITSYLGPFVVTGTVQAPYNTTVYAVNDWKITGSPQVAVSPTQSKPEGLGIQLIAHGAQNVCTTYSWLAGVLTLNTVNAHGLSPGDKAVLVGFESIGLDGTYSVASTPGPNTFTINYSSQVQQGGTLGVIYRYGIGDAWRPQDVGSFVRINGGLARITGYVSSSIVNATIIKEMTSTIAAPPSGWSLEGIVWNTIDGFPRAVALHQQRLIFAGSPGYPRTLWGSKTAEYYNFTIGTDDADGYEFELASSDSVDQIAHIYSMRRLVIQTFGGEFIGGGGNSNAITPTNIQIDPQTAYGSNQVKPVRVGSELLFVQRSGRRIRALSYNFDSDAYVADDLARLAEHITETGIVDMAYQQEPYTMVWAVRSDGMLLSLTYDRGQQVIGWARKITDGIVESVACIPAGDHDQVWMSVLRTVNGAPKRYIERLDEAMLVDCGIARVAAEPQLVFTGLGHLEGEMVAVVGDGTYRGEYLVTGGQITLDTDAQAVNIGLFFAPEIQLLNPVLNTPTGSSAISALNTSEATVQFLDTCSCTVNGQPLSFREFGDSLLDQPIDPFTGYKRIENMDPWNRGETPVTISQEDCMPFHMLSVIRRLTIND
jgi:hypothetical protein